MTPKESIIWLRKLADVMYLAADVYERILEGRKNEAKANVPERFPKVVQERKPGEA